VASDFLGRGWSFPPEFTPERGVRMVSGETDILQSLHVLFSTIRTERIMLPGYGSELSTLVFENQDAGLVLRARHLICDAILLHEPRILVEERDVEVESDPNRPGLVWIRIGFTIAQTNTRSNMVYPFYQEEGNNVRSLDGNS
jgi:phage baseplate assembly protein W